jgi:hypothetical protein
VLRLLSPLALVVLLLPAPSAGQGTSVLVLLPTEGRTLSVGGEYTGALSTADYRSPEDYLLEAWEMQGRAGTTVTVDLESDQFDARLYIAGPGLAETLQDDDGGGGCDARITFTFLENGTFRVVASSYGETGTYTVRVSERPEPAPTYGCGEVNPATLLSLTTEDRTLELGSLEAGILGPASPTIADGRVAQAWALTGEAGEQVSVVLESDDFDAYLYVVGPGLSDVLSDDDGAGSRNSLIQFTLPTAGPFTVVATSFSSGSFGPYTIRVGEPVDPTTLSLEGVVDLGQSVDGELAFEDRVVVDGRRGRIWGYEATAGQRVSIDLRSEQFDTYLYVMGPGLQEPRSDDDGGDDTNSSMAITFPETGTYRIVVSSFGSGSSGSYTLTVAPQ